MSAHGVALAVEARKDLSVSSDRGVRFTHGARRHVDQCVATRRIPDDHYSFEHPLLLRDMRVSMMPRMHRYAKSGLWAISEGLA